MSKIDDALNGDYTPGPWESRGQHVIGPVGVGVAWCGAASVFGPDSYLITKLEAERNAKLIAATPDLADEVRRLRAANARLRMRVNMVIGAVSNIQAAAPFWAQYITDLCETALAETELRHEQD